MRWDSIGDFCSRLIILNADHISVVLLEMWRFPGGEKFIRIRGGAGVGRDSCGVELEGGQAGGAAVG